MKRLLAAIFILMLFFSCKKETTSIYSNLASFDKIELNDAFEVYLSESNIFSIEIVGDKNIIDHVNYNVDSGILSIDNKRKIKWLSPGKNGIKLYINSKPLSKVTASEGCNIQTITPITSNEFGIVLTGKANHATLDLDAKTFYYWNNFPCGGNLTLTGKSETLKLWNFALMSVNAKNLVSKYAIVENSSTGDCEVNVLNKFEYSIKGKGNIHLYGSPSEIVEDISSSSGRLIKH